MIALPPTEPAAAGTPEPEVELKEIVMGLHWYPSSGAPADLDAFCILCDVHGRVLDVIHPGHPRTADGSVVHTGDSRDGASSWDDERIFVFLDALPATVALLAFAVASVTGQPFDQVPEAVCHVSDRISEAEWVRIELTALAGRTLHVVASLRRERERWRLCAGAPVPDEQLLAVVRARAVNPKHDASRVVQDVPPAS
jgi:stress response protein SCP2